MGGLNFEFFLVDLLIVKIMAFFALFGDIFWRQMLSSILSFVKNPFPTASRYIKISSLNSQPVKNLSEVNTLIHKTN